MRKNPVLSRQVLAILLVVLAMIALFASTPKNGEFWWSESPRNALSGAFVRDLIIELPFEDPVGWAEQYYAQYPSLVILFYPPMVHVVLGLFYLFLGVSHLTAMIAIFSFYTAMALAVYALGRRFFGELTSAGLAIAFSASPEVSMWGRQVLLEVPMMAFLFWSIWFGLRYIDSSRWTDLFAAAVFAVASLYTKQTATVVIAVLVAVILMVRGRSALRRPSTWIVGLSSVVLLLPLVLIQAKFARFNAVNLANHPAAFKGSWVESLLWYPLRLPEVLSWFIVVPALVFLVLSISRLREVAKRKDTLFFVAWLMVGVVFLTAISIKQTRQGLPFYLPIVFAAFAGVSALTPRAWREFAGLSLGLLVLASTLLFHPSPYVDGYNRAADFIAETAPQDGIVLFSGHKDGDFVFNMRTNAERRDLSTLRADKLFLDFAVFPSLGLDEKDYTEEELQNALTRFGVSYVVSDEVSFSDTPVMQRLLEVLHGNGFEKVQEVPLRELGEDPSIKSLSIFRNRSELPLVPESPEFNIKLIDRKIKKGE